jgi:hypothetical protein
MTKRRFTLLDAVDDPLLFAPWFKDKASWAAWFAFLRALFGLPLTAEQLALYRDSTGRAEAPTTPASEGWLICGRRSGKSFALALVAVYLAAFHSYRQYLAPGERGVVLVVASDRKQARVIFRYVRALLLGVPMLRKLVDRETTEAFDLSNSTSIEIMAASYRSLRGYTVIAALLDELAFWPTDDSANPDTEIIAAIKPAMATIPNAMLLCASSPYAQRGALFDAFKRHHGRDGSVLVWRAPTRTMNATVPQSVVDAAMEADPASAAAEYLAQWRTDVETFVGRDVVESAVVPGRHELPRMDHTRYSAFVDPSGGSSDSMTLAVAHMQGSRVVLDLIRERLAPFSPDACVKEFSDALRGHGVAQIVGDRYAGEWPREAFRKHGVDYRVADKAKSDLYLALLPLLNSDRVELLDSKRLVAQLCGLERKTARSGKDSIDHVPGGRDDVANAVAGAAVLAVEAAAQPRVPDRQPGVLLEANGLGRRRPRGRDRQNGDAIVLRERPWPRRRLLLARLRSAWPRVVRAMNILKQQRADELRGRLAALVERRANLAADSAQANTLQQIDDEIASTCRAVADLERALRTEP